jgi:hypothetical protein
MVMSTGTWKAQRTWEAVVVDQSGLDLKLINGILIACYQSRVMHSGRALSPLETIGRRLLRNRGLIDSPSTSANENLATSRERMTCNSSSLSVDIDDLHIRNEFLEYSRETPSVSPSLINDRIQNRCHTQDMCEDHPRSSNRRFEGQ